MPSVTDIANEIMSNFNFFDVLILLKPLLMFVFGMAVYAVFIFKFYRFVARQDIFELDLDKYKKAKNAVTKKLEAISLYVIKYILLFPLFLFFWFVVLTILLVFLTKSGSIQNILLVAIALIGAIRVTSYYNEELSKDLAKMLPFAVLGVFLIDITYFNFSESVDLVLQIPSMWLNMIYYLLFLIILEFVLRVIHSFFRIFVPEKKDEDNE